MEAMTITHRVASYECSADSLMKPESFMHLCQEIAETHASRADFGYEWGQRNNLIWVELQGDFQFFRRPSWKEEVQLTTNTGRASALQARRYVRMTDAEGNVLAQADLMWALIDVTTRRLTPLKRTSLVLPDECPALITEAMPAADESVTPLTAETEYTTTRRDIDFNAHINNSAYLIWTMDTLPEEWMQGKAPARVRIAFKHESVAGEHLYLRHSMSGNRSTHTVTDGEQVRALIDILWA